MENAKEKLSCDLWFWLPDMKSNSEAIFWNGSEKFMSVKTHVHKKTSVAKLFKHIENKN